jgi:hypothetical protein
VPRSNAPNLLSNHQQTTWISWETSPMLKPKDIQSWMEDHSILHLSSDATVYIAKTLTTWINVVPLLKFHGKHPIKNGRHPIKTQLSIFLRNFRSWPRQMNSCVVTHFWYPINKIKIKLKKYIYKKKKTEQCRFDTVPLPVHCLKPHAPLKHGTVTEPKAPRPLSGRPAGRSPAPHAQQQPRSPFTYKYCY